MEDRRGQADGGRQQGAAQGGARGAGGGTSPSAVGTTTGASKQRHHVAGDGQHDDRLAAIQRGERKQAGPDVPRPLRGKGRRTEPAVPPGPEAV